MKIRAGEFSMSDSLLHGNETWLICSSILFLEKEVVYEWKSIGERGQGEETS